MDAARKYVFCFAAIIISSLISVPTSFATTKFVLTTNDNSQGTRCSFVEIDNGHIKCNTGKLSLNFELSNVRGLEITNDGNTYQIQQFTPDNIEKIIELNSAKIKSRNEKPNNNGEQSNHNFVQSIKRIYSRYIGNITSSSYKCDGKIYCSEMTSCEEAIFYLSNCPGTKIDGNNDGIPCEKQWCGH